MVKKSTKVVMGSVAAAAALVCGWGVVAGADDDSQQVCELNGDVVSDDQCGSGGNSSAHWYYIPSGSHRPAVGGKAVGGSSVKPVSRGGFGFGSWGGGG